VNVKLLLDLNVIFDCYNNERQALFPESMQLKKLLATTNNAQGYISSSALDNLSFIKYQELKQAHPELTRNQINKIIELFISELLAQFKLAKTPSYIKIDFEDIEDSQMLASAQAIDAKLVTRDKRLLTKYKNETLSVTDAIKLLHTPIAPAFIDLQKQYIYLQNKIEQRTDIVLNHGKYIMGPEIQELEEKLAEYVGIKHAITCANGTDALTLALMVLGIKEGDAVFCPTFTFFATAEVISFANATPVFVDSNEQTFNICPQDLEKQIKEVIIKGRLTPKAIIAVDLFGLPANYPAIQAIADKYDLKIIEDAAQGFGGSITDKNGNEQKVGSFGDIATTSFFPAKPLGCYGDGGAVFTNSDEYAELLRSYRVHGKGSDKYDNIRIGMNSRLDTIQAAILLEKLAEFPQELINRNKAAAHYEKELANTYKTPQVPKGYTSSWAQYTLLSENREQVMARYKEQGVPTVIYYGTCMHQQTAFDYLGYQQGGFPVAEKLCKQVFSLPMHPYLDLNILK